VCPKDAESALLSDDFPMISDAEESSRHNL
jgi:hypothetical protein